MNADLDEYLSQQFMHYSESLVYFVEANDLIKIGYTRQNIATRLQQLRTASPTAKLLGLIRGGIEGERYLHKRFAAHRVHGEWFKPVPELLAFIEALGPRRTEVPPMPVLYLPRSRRRRQWQWWN